MGKIGTMELVLILGIALVVFGPKKLPEIGKAMGQTIRQFKDHANKVSEEPLEDKTSNLKEDESLNA